MSSKDHVKNINTLSLEMYEAVVKALAPFVDRWGKLHGLHNGEDGMTDTPENKNLCGFGVIIWREMESGQIRSTDLINSNPPLITHVLGRLAKRMSATDQPLDGISKA